MGSPLPNVHSLIFQFSIMFSGERMADRTRRLLVDFDLFSPLLAEERDSLLIRLVRGDFSQQLASLQTFKAIRNLRTLSEAFHCSSWLCDCTNCLTCRRKCLKSGSLGVRMTE